MLKKCEKTVEFFPKMWYHKNVCGFCFEKFRILKDEYKEYHKQKIWLKMSIERWLLHLIYEYHGYGILLYVLITNSLAGVLSFCIGLERQLRGEPAGVRTHAILAMGSSLLMTISIWAIRMADGSIDIVMGTVNADLKKAEREERMKNILSSTSPYSGWYF